MILTAMAPSRGVDLLGGLALNEWSHRVARHTPHAVIPLIDEAIIGACIHRMRALSMFYVAGDACLSMAAMSFVEE